MKYRPSWELGTIPEKEWKSEAGRRSSAKRGDRTGGRPIVLRPCPKCNQQFPTAIWKKHKPHCQTAQAHTQGTGAVE